MADHKQPPLIDKPLRVEVVDNEVVLDGELPVSVSLTRDAALETGLDLMNAALGIDSEARPAG